MKTTNKIGLVCLAFLILMTSALAVQPPYPVFGEVTLVGDLVPMFQVTLDVCDSRSTIDNCNPMETVTMDTDSTSMFGFELSNINPIYRTKWCYSKGVCYAGDFVKLTVCDNHPNCEVIRELTGTALELDFNLGVDKEVEIVKEVEKIVEVPVKADDGTDIPVVIADEPTTLERWVAFKWFPWFTGFLAIVLFFMGSQYGRAKKMLSTLIKKHNKKGYGK